MGQERSELVVMHPVAGAIDGDDADTVDPSEEGTSFDVRQRLGARVYVRVGGETAPDLRIDDPGISRNHAELRRSGGDVTIVDLGSTNGIVINGRRVNEDTYSVQLMDTNGRLVSLMKADLRDYRISTTASMPSGRAASALAISQ